MKVLFFWKVFIYLNTFEKRWIMNLENLVTEKRNKSTYNLDEMSTVKLLETMNNEDALVARAVREKIPDIAKAVNAIVDSLQLGGRLIYIGAGTSGRIGLLDAVECPPTFGVNPDEVIGLIAGGEKAFIKAVEGAEDDFALAQKELERIELSAVDVVVGIAASGRTPYVIGGLKFASSVGAKTIALSCNQDSEIGKHAQIVIEVDNGPEVLTGSTRLKAGTSQKLICNMLSTASMIGIGKVYGNLMVDLQLTNEKLVDRAKRIVIEATGCNEIEATDSLIASGNKPKVAILMILSGMDKLEAEEKLIKSGGFIKKALE